MAFSGSTDFNLTATDSIREALELTGVIDIVESTPSEIQASVLRTANIMLKAWQAKGLFLHSYKTATLFLALDQQSYLLGPSGDHCTESYVETTLSADAATGAGTISLTSTTGITNGDNIGVVLDDGSLFWTTVSATAGTDIAATLTSAASSGNAVYAYTTKIVRPLEVTDIRFRESASVETPVPTVSQTEYFTLVNKTSKGRCVQVLYDPQLTNAKLYVWPVCDDVTSQLVFRYKRPVDDLDADANDVMIPVDWYEAWTLGLAYRIAPKLRVPLADQAALKARADEALAAIDDFEESSIFFQPDWTH